MAEGEYKNTSEELQNECDVNVECDPCKDDGITVTAEGFCMDCNDYLCKPCYRNHKIPRPSKHHVLQDKYAMPPAKPTGKCVPCRIHKSEFVTQYCKTHDVVGCGVCMLQGQAHLKCVTIDIGPALVKNVRGTLEFKSCLESVSESIEECKEDKQNIDVVKSNLDQHYVSAQTSIDNVLMVLKENDIRRINALWCTSESLHKELISVQTDTATQLRSEEYSFIKMKTAKMIVHKTREHSTLLKQETNPTNYGFIGNASTVSRNGSTNLLWTSNNDYRLIPVTPLRKKNMSMQVKEITGHGDMIYALVLCTTRSGFGSGTRYHIITVNSANGRVEEKTNVSLTNTTDTYISYSSHGLFVAAYTNLSKTGTVTLYRKSSGKTALYKADTFQMDIEGKFVGQSVISDHARTGTAASTFSFQSVGDKVHSIAIESMQRYIIYHDTNSGAFLSFSHGTLKLFDDNKMKVLGEKETGIEHRIQTVVKYANKFYILWGGIGVFQCNSKDLSDWCQIIQITDSTNQCNTMAVNECHICLAPTQDGLIAAFRKP